MRLLLLCHGFNSLTQRLFVELRERGHELAIEFDVNDAVTAEAVALMQPDLVLAPFLRRRIPESVWRAVPCLVVHPGPPGDRGPAALDWAILDRAAEWGVTVLQATGDYDAGPVWATAGFATRPATKGSLYRHEVAEAAVVAMLRAIERFASGEQPDPAPPGRWRPAPTQAGRAIDWQRDDTATVLRKLHAADGSPGLRDTLAGRDYYLFDAQDAPGLSGTPGTLLARSGEALARATVDGAVWLGRLRAVPEAPERPTLKLPATTLVRAGELPELPGGYRDLWYEEAEGVGTLHFPFYNGALCPARARRLLEAWGKALARDTRVLVLAGGPDFWCNGIDLNAIEAADSPAEASWEAINAIDDLAQAVINTGDKLTVAALSGNAGAGGVFLALAADQVWARTGVVLNPHYKGMGNLYGSEYWTYLLPRRAGTEGAQRVTEARLPVGSTEARRLGLVDEAFGATVADFRAEVARRAASLAQDPALPALLADKRRRRAADEATKPLAQYRAEELARMRLNFFGFDPSYHVARYNFVFKVPKSRTPYYLAAHRRSR